MTKHYRSIQWLRGISALLVVAYHTVVIAHDRMGLPLPHFNAGMAGVDIFFAISGFIMMAIICDPRAQDPTAWQFLKRRLIRIVPFYWLATTTKLAMLLAGGAVIANWNIIASYLFIPVWNDMHEAYPILVPGWTLSFEMFFYLLLTAALKARLHPLWPLTILFTALTAIGLFIGPFAAAPLHLLDPQLLEFVFGMWIANAVLAGRTLDAQRAWIYMLAGAAMILASMALNGDLAPARVIFFGIPAALLLYGALSLEAASFWSSPYCQALGDASYSIYLTHLFAIAAVRNAITALQLQMPPLSASCCWVHCLHPVC